MTPITLDTIVAEVADRLDEFDRLAYVPRDMVDRMVAARIFRASVPKRFGGDALPPQQFLQIVERIAQADGSAAWVAGFGSSSTYLAALPIESQAVIYQHGPDVVFGGGLWPMQPAVAVDGGWEVTGHWRFASGCKSADWLGVGIGGGASGTPLTAVLPASDVDIVENWDVVGLRGTGSHDLRLHKKRVDPAWTFVRGAPATIDEPLYRYPAVSYQAQVHAVVNLGLARAALDLVLAMAGTTKTTTGAPKLADRAYYRAAIGKAEAAMRSARAFFYESTEAAWASILAGDPVSPAQATVLRLSATHAAHAGADVVQQVYRIAGTAAIYAGNRLQWILRDAMVVPQHAFLSESTYDSAGALFVGVPPGAPFP